VARSAICVSVTGETHGGDRVGHVGGKALHVDREILRGTSLMGQGKVDEKRGWEKGDGKVAQASFLFLAL
jgi:hypothetical protein